MVKLRSSGHIEVKERTPNRPEQVRWQSVGKRVIPSEIEWGKIEMFTEERLKDVDVLRLPR